MGQAIPARDPFGMQQLSSRHVHPNLQETFTILHGVMSFQLGQKGANRRVVL